MCQILYKELKDYHKRGIYPFHMPGHKRNENAVDLLPGLTEDITEIEGFDQLHHPTGILREAQEAASTLYDTDETLYSVNGSTGALLAAICACTTYGGSILMARNCHRSVYHGVCLKRLDSHYLYPAIAVPYGLNGPIQPRQVENALAAHPDVQAVLITSPTYDGVASPIKEIADISHQHGLPLIVDEAHGAHFPFHDYFPKSALEQGADIVVHSLHKTLPSLTQTALLHVKGRRVDRGRIHRYMEIFQTSSPSYLLMGSMDACIRKLLRSGPGLFERYVDRLQGSRTRLAGLRYIDLVEEDLAGDGEDPWEFDRSKLLLDVQKSGMSGHRLYQWLWKERGLQMEMETETYVLGMTSIADTDEGFERLCRSLELLEKTWSKEGRVPYEKQTASGQDLSAIAGEKVLSIASALEQDLLNIPLEQSIGCVAGGFLSLYPPGIPLAVPGEKITARLVDTLIRCHNAGSTIQGCVGAPVPEIPIVKQSLDKR